jgi:hypothetical protein
MRTSPLSLRHAAGFAASILCALSAGAVMAQDVGLDANCAPLLTHRQQRLYDKANDGTPALSQFVFIRRAILQVDVYETATWAESLNAARASCTRNHSVAAAANSVTASPRSDL